MKSINCVVWAMLALGLAPLAGAQSYSITDLGVFPGGDTTQPTGLNNHGVVVGSANTSGAAAAHAFVWTSAGGLRDLGTLGNPADDSVAEAINNSDQVVGYSFLGNDAGARAFLWTSGAGMKSLGTLGGNNSSATGINDAGQVVGTSLIAPVRGSSATHPFLWTAAGGMQDLGTFGGDTSVAFAINDKNQVVGYADSVSGNTNAFIWNASRGMQNIEAGPGAAADGINDAGQVVGSEGVPGGAYVWTATQHAQLLVNLIPPDSGWTLSNGDGVNAVGQIAVTGLIGNEQHGGLLTPVN